MSEIKQKSEAQHTPGPWRADYDDVWYISAAPGTAATTSHPADSLVVLDIARDDDTTEADAHLIAAAPDLLDALTLAHNWLDNGKQLWESQEAFNQVMEQIEAALAKAKGLEIAKNMRLEEGEQK